MKGYAKGVNFHTSANKDFGRPGTRPGSVSVATHSRAMPKHHPKYSSPSSFIPVSGGLGDADSDGMKKGGSVKVFKSRVPGAMSKDVASTPPGPPAGTDASTGPGAGFSSPKSSSLGKGKGFAKGGHVGKLNAAKRNALPAGKFAGPDRSYPVPDKSHAANAKARATQAVNAGRMSAGQKAAIDAKANKVLQK
jgi:hypothetical protein